MQQHKNLKRTEENTIYRHDIKMWSLNVSHFLPQLKGKHFLKKVQFLSILVVNYPLINRGVLFTWFLITVRYITACVNA